MTAAGLKALRDEYARSLQPARTLAAEAAKLEHEISDLVNAAYGLTPDERRHKLPALNAEAVRLIGVGVSGLKAPLRQLSLWGAEDEKSRRLQEAVDLLREKYGKDAIQRGQAEPGRRAEHGWLHHREVEEKDNKGQD